MTMVEIVYECGCRLFYALPFDDYTDAENYVLDSGMFSNVENIREYLFEVI